MPKDPAPDETAAHLQQVGLLCAQWAYLEWLLEIANWWFLNLLDGTNDGRTITGSWNSDTLARKARELAHRKLDGSDLDAVKEVAAGVEANLGERNLAVHGVRSVKPDEIVRATVARGKYKNTEQVMTPIRLNTLNGEVKRLIDIIEPLLAKHGVIEGSGPTGSTGPSGR